MAVARGGAPLSWRTWGVIGIGAALAAGAGATGLACVSGPSLPHDLATAAERIEAEASRAGGDQLLPERYADFDRRLVEARRVLRQEEARWCFLRDRARVEQAFSDLERDGQALVLAARQRREARERAAAEQLAAGERRLTRLRALADGVGMFLPPAPLAATDLALREARHYLEAGSAERVPALLEAARAGLQRMEDHARRQGGRYLDGPAMTRWRRWVQESVALSRAGPVLVVAKAERRLFLYRHGRVVVEYPVDLGYNALAEKLAEGDGATPEGRFRIVTKKSGAGTRYDRALLLDYPTPADRERHALAVRRGLVSPRARVGGLIEIHGQVPGPTDRTSGCVSLAPPALRVVFDLVEPGTPVTIVGAVSTRNPVALHLRAWRQERADVL
jgi:hypothetical protein